LDVSFKKRVPDANKAEKMAAYIAEEMRFTKYQEIIERALLRSRP
jgi:hypothetical protein